MLVENASAFEGDKAKIFYPAFILNSGKLTSRAANNNMYHYDPVVTENNQVFTLDYANTDKENVIFYSEAEDIEGMKVATGSTAVDRCSMGKGGYASEDVTITTLEPGIYKIYISQRGGGTRDWGFDFKINDEIVFTTNTLHGYNETSESGEVIVRVESDLVLGAKGSNNDMLDYIYIQKIGDEISENVTVSAAGWATYAPAHDVVVPADAEVYYASGNGESSVKLTLVEEGSKIKAGEGVLVKNAGTYTFAYTTDAVAIEGNKLVGTTVATTLGEGEAYILANQNGEAVFSLCSAGTIAAGKAYLPVSNLTAAGARALRIVIDGDATGISSAVVEKGENGAVFNLSGQKVDSNYKGIVIVNGKKVVK